MNRYSLFRRKQKSSLISLMLSVVLNSANSCWRNWIRKGKGECVTIFKWIRLQSQNLFFGPDSFKIFRCFWTAPPRPVRSSLICIIHFTSYRTSFNYCFKNLLLNPAPDQKPDFDVLNPLLPVYRPSPLSKNRRRALFRFLLRGGVGGALSVHRLMDLFLVEWQLWVDRVVTKILSRWVDTKSR